MVDCRPAGAPPQEIAHPNGASMENNQSGSSTDMSAHGVSTPASVRASTPASTNTVTTFTGNYNGGMNPPTPGPAPPAMMGMNYGCAPYACGMKSVVWCGSPMHAPHMPPPPPPLVNPHVYKSAQPNGSDLPMNDIATLRFYFNLGVECMWAAYGPPPHIPPPPLQRHYTPRDLTQDMQQISLQDRQNMHEAHKHKPQDKPPLNQHKGNGQRPLLGPRFKRGNNQDGGNQNNNHNQNKGHNNMPNKGPNNRRNSHTESRPPFVGAAGMGGEVPEMVEQPIVSFPYIPYPPPMYPVPYYQMEPEPAMMGMMGGMGYVGYEEGVEYAPMQHYYPPQYPPQPQPQPQPQLQHHPEHK